MESALKHKLLFTVKHYDNKGLDLLLDLEIKDDADHFNVLLSFEISIELEPDLLVRDCYPQCVRVQVNKNEWLPEQELNFYELSRNYKIDQCSPIAQQLAEETEKYLSTLIFEKLKLKFVIAE